MQEIELSNHPELMEYEQFSYKKAAYEMHAAFL